MTDLQSVLTACVIFRCNSILTFDALDGLAEANTEVGAKNKNSKVYHFFYLSTNSALKYHLRPGNLILETTFFLLFLFRHFGLTKEDKKRPLSFL